MANPKIGPFVGINNRIPAHQLEIVERGRKAGDYLRNAVNVDLTASGTLQRRPGTTREIVGEDVHSLWGDDKGAYFIDGESLIKHPGAVVRTGLIPGLRASFARDAMGGVIWSNGAVIERIWGDASSPIAPNTPNPEPSITTNVGGSLPAGRYQIAVASVVGETESAPTWPVQMLVAEGGRVDISGLTGSVRIYMSPCDGDILFLVASTDAGEASLPTQPLTDAPQLTTLGLRPIPPGHIVRVFRGRTLVASGSALYVSEPYALGLFNPLRGVVPLPERITVCEPCDDGVYLCADKTYWLAGKDITQAELIPVLPYGATEGTGGINPDDKTVFWYSTNGVVVGAPGGQVKNIQDNTVAVGAAGFGAMGHRDQNGLRQLVASVFGAQPTVAVASSFAEAEVIRKESML